MNKWITRISDHRVRSGIEALEQLLSSRPGGDSDSYPEEWKPGVSRIEAILRIIRQRVEGVDSFLASPVLLEEIANHIDATAGSFSSFISDPQLSYLQAANDSVDSALSTASRVTIPETIAELADFARAATSYRDAVDRRLHELKQTADKLEVEHQQQLEGLARLTEKIALEEARITQVVAEYQSQFSNGQDSRMRAFGDSQTSRDTLFKDAVAEFASKVDELDEKLKQDRDSLVAQGKDDLFKISQQLQRDAERIRTAMETQKARVDDLVGVIGNQGMTGGYVAAAASARWSMWFWQFATFGSLVAVCVVASNTLPPVIGSTEPVNWVSLIARALLLGSFGILAAYGSGQAERFFLAEQRNKRLALELAAIGPYLEPLPPEARDKFRIDIGDRTFGREEANGAPARSMDSIVSLLNSKGFRDLMEFAREYTPRSKN